MSSIGPDTRSVSVRGCPGSPAGAIASAAVIATAVAVLVFFELIAVSFGVVWPLPAIVGGGLWVRDGSLAIAALGSAVPAVWLFRRVYRVERRLAVGLDPDDGPVGPERTAGGPR